MEIYDRIRELRKNHLGLSQTKFGEELGVSRSEINNIERNTLARPEKKLSLYKLICSRFKVSEEWLFNGTGSIFVESRTFSLDEFIKENGGTDLEVEIIKGYFCIDQSTRKGLIEHFKNYLSNITITTDNPLPKTTTEFEKQYPPTNKNITKTEIG